MILVCLIELFFGKIRNLKVVLNHRLWYVGIFEKRVLSEHTLAFVTCFWVPTLLFGRYWAPAYWFIIHTSCFFTFLMLCFVSWLLPQLPSDGFWVNSVDCIHRSSSFLWKKTTLTGSSDSVLSYNVMCQPRIATQDKRPPQDCRMHWTSAFGRHIKCFQELYNNDKMPDCVHNI
jgi:hypothetical protein